MRLADGSKLWSSTVLCTTHLRCTLEISFSSFLSQNLQNYCVSREESPMLPFYELDSPAPYSMCCLLIILSLVMSLSCSCLSSPVFYFSDGLISCTVSPQPQHAFLHVGFDFLLLVGLDTYNRSFQSLKKKKE